MTDTLRTLVDEMVGTLSLRWGNSWPDCIDVDWLARARAALAIAAENQVPIREAMLRQREEGAQAEAAKWRACVEDVRDNPEFYWSVVCDRILKRREALP